MSLLATTLGALAFTAAPALAAAPAEPQTENAQSVTGTSAIFEGTLNPLSKATVGGFFAYSNPEGLTCLEGRTAALEGFNGEQEVQAQAVHALVGLEPERTYKFCLVATNQGGVGMTSGKEVSVTTPAIAPRVEFEVAYPKQTQAMLEADVNAENQEVTKCEFQYGTDAALTTSTTVECEPKTLQGVFGPQGVFVSVSGLQADQTYYYRAIAENAAHEKDEGAIMHFTTAPEAPEPLKPEPVTGTTATFKGVLNPKATLAGSPGSYEFIYWQSASECEFFTEQVEYKTTPLTDSLGDAEEAVSAQVTGLLPDTPYTYCLLARNSAGDTVLSAPVTFTTPIVQPIIESESSADVSADEARMETRINPGGLQTSYRFEYGPATGSYDASVPVPEGEIAAGVNSVSLSAVATGLQPATTYHYRVLATNSQSPAGGTPGADQTFTTPPAQGSNEPGSCPNEQRRAEQPYGLRLPDCRAYEMVSPLDKDDYDVMLDGSRVSVSGEALTYLADGAFSEPPSQPSSATIRDRYIARRDPEHDRWSTENITPPLTITNLADEVPFGSLLFTPSLSEGVLDSQQVPLAKGEEPGFHNLDVADFASSPISYQQVTPARPGEGPYEAGPGQIKPSGASTDLSHVVFQEIASSHVDEWATGEVNQVDVPPAGTKFEHQDKVGSPGSGETGDTWHAVSESGLRVFFTAGEVRAAENNDQLGQLYVRENPEQAPVEGSECTVSTDACTIEVSKSQKNNGMGPGGTDPAGIQPARYWDASADGSRVLFTSRSELTNDAYTGPEGEDKAANLYECEIVEEHGEQTCKLIDLSVPTAAERAEDPDGAAVLGVVNASEDGSHVYFVAEGALAQGATSGQPNLYISHGGDVTFIATLAPATQKEADGGEPGGKEEAGGDSFDWTGAREQFGGYAGNHPEGPGEHTARVTPDGTALAFESERSLTGYDNEQAEPGECEHEVVEVKETGSCREVYLYDATTAKLVCASCDPAGVRPVGRAQLGGYGEENGAGSDQFTHYLPRNLSEDGRRLFFESPDALVPQDSNGLTDVYEWEAEGEGSCAQAAGCVLPISDIAGDNPSHFMDASPNGDDVFINTIDQLVPADTDDLPDVYDVRVGGGFPVTGNPPACSNGDSCKPPVSPQPSVFAPTGSATFNGIGNFPAAVAPPPPNKAATKAVKCKKPKKLSHGKCAKPKQKKTKRTAKAKRAKNNRRTKS